jgi:ATP-dependent protease ClpP protease subunit
MLPQDPPALAVGSMSREEIWFNTEKALEIGLIDKIL